LIEVCSVSKSYGGVPVLRDISFTADSGRILGLVGYNGAGKTTLLRIMADVYRPDGGRVLADGVPVRDNPEVKARTILLTEGAWFLPQASLRGMRDYYRGYYGAWNDLIFERLCSAFRLDPSAQIAGFSRGMRRQASVILAFAAAPKFLLLDEVFDGLDTAMRKAMRLLLSGYVEASGATAIVSSHNLGEFEDSIDKVAMIHNCELKYEGAAAAMKSEYGSIEKYFLETGDECGEAFSGIFSDVFPSVAGEVRP
jgi:ABC-2 type transport system ATP-binding protein